MNDFITIGQLMRPHGVRGDIRCLPHTHDLNRHRQLKSVRLQYADGSRKELQVEKSSRHGEIWHFKFVGFDSPEACQELVNAEIQIPLTERVPPPPGQFYFSDLEGLTAVDDAGQKIGTVLGVEELPSVNAFLLRINGKEVFAPWIDACVGAIDLDARTVQIHLDYLDDLCGGGLAH